MSRLHALSPVFNRLLILIRDMTIGALALGMGLAFGQTIAGGTVTWPITLIGVSAYALVIVANPLAGLLLWIVTAPFSRFIYLDLVLGRGIPNLTLTRICTGLLMVLVLAQLAAGKKNGIRLVLLDGVVLATLIGIGAALPASKDGLKSAVTAFGDSYLVPGVIYFLARFLVRGRRQAEQVCSAFVILGFILTTVAIQEQLSGSVLFVYSERSWVYTKDIHRLAGLLGSPAFFATLIAMSSAFAVYRFMRSTTMNSRVVYGLIAAYTVIGVYFTYNRAGWLSVAVNLLIMAIAWPAFRRLFAAAMVAALMAVVLSWSSLQYSAVITQRLGARGPVDYRLEVWAKAATILAHSPIFGLGYGNFGQVYLQYDPAWTRANVLLPAPHNSFLEVLFNTGLVGGLPYMAMFAIIATGILRFYRRARDKTDGEAGLILVFGLAILAYVVQAMFVDMVSAFYVNMVFMLAVGSLFGWQESRDNS